MIFRRLGKWCFQLQKPELKKCLHITAAANAVGPKTGILMLNMGGPQTLDEVENYLTRIMTDRDMMQLPVQSSLGPFIARNRAPEVREKYSQIGGGSPILDWTKKQGQLLCARLDQKSHATKPHKFYIAFRYANPLTETALEHIERDAPDRVIIFSQYPQYSCSTTGSSFNAIYAYYQQKKLSSSIKWSIIDRWSTHPLLVKTFAERIKEVLYKFPPDVRNTVIILFSAHSLPMKVVQRGDSYPFEVGATVNLVMKELNYCNPYSLVWQSKVGPLTWLSPFTDEAIRAYAKQGKKNFLLVPIAFVNEHIETLHEMDIEFCKDLRDELGVEIKRAAAPNDHPAFIDAMADLVFHHMQEEQTVSPKFLTRCPHCTNRKCQQAKDWFYKLCSA